MSVKNRVLTIAIWMSLLLGVVPFGVSYFWDVPTIALVLSALSCVAWCTSALLFHRHRQILITVEEAVSSIGLADLRGDLTNIISAFSIESKRYHRAAFGFRASIGTGTANLSENLARIVQLAYEELNAQSVELSLFDEVSGLWSQAMLIGYPSLGESQSMLVAGADSGKNKIVEERSGGRVIAKPVIFAGTMFGALRVELREGAELTASDRQVLHLLATQGGILLVDARFTEEALRLRQLSDETNRAKTGFLANLSHELRGPLGIILNAVELSMEGLCGELSEPHLEMFRMIKDSGDHLLDLVNDVLDYAKVEAGKITVTPLELPLKPLLEDLCSVVRSQAVAKRHTFLLEEVDAKLGVIADKRHARQILINFLTNAVKYTPEGGEIIVSAARMVGNRVKIQVKDSGIGIPDDQREKVFGAFERVDHAYAMSQVGTGLGMPLTKRLVELNGGKIGFESVESKGSTFWAVLPAIEIDESKTVGVPDESGQIKAQGHGESILLVDHDGESRRILERYLVEQGFAIIEASTAAEVMKILREIPIKLAVVENDLPDLPGEEMVATIRSTPNAAAVPIILLSSRAFVFDIERFLRLGVDRCLSKPVALSELALTARRLIDETKSLEASPLP